MGTSTSSASGQPGGPSPANTSLSGAIVAWTWTPMWNGVKSAASTVTTMLNPFAWIQRQNGIAVGPQKAIEAGAQKIHQEENEADVLAYVRAAPATPFEKVVSLITW